MKKSEFKTLLAAARESSYLLGRLGSVGSPEGAKKANAEERIRCVSLWRAVDAAKDAVDWSDRGETPEITSV